MLASSRTYALGRVHFMLGGGWLVTGILLGVYVLGFLSGVALYFYADYMAQQNGEPPGSMKGVAMGIVALMLALQGVVLILVGGYRVSASIRSDISSRMLESHRLMPVTSFNAMWGYIFGPTLPMCIFALVNLLLSCMLGATAGVHPTRMFLNQAMIFSFAVFCWAIIAYGTFIYRHIFFIAVGVMVLGLCTSLLVYTYFILPGFALVVTPFLGETVFNLTGGAIGIQPGDWTYGIGLMGQAAYFVLFFIAGCRLYRGTYPTAFTLIQAILLLTTWTVLSMIGIAIPEYMTASRLFGGRDNEYEMIGAVQVIASLVVSVLVTAVPVWSWVQRERREKVAGFEKAAVLLVIGSLATLPAVGGAWMKSYSAVGLLVTWLVMLSQVLVVYSVARLMRRQHFILTLLIVVLATLVISIGPIVVELIRMMIMDSQGTRPTEQSFLPSLSPAGLLAGVWADLKPIYATVGTLWAWIVAGLIFATVMLLERGKAKGAGENPAPPATPAVAAAGVAA